MWNVFFAAIVAYLVGSIPFGYLLYRLRAGKDIRTTGSGNIGATNVLRAAGFLPAAATLLLDAGKGYAAVCLAERLSPDSSQAVAVATVLVMAGHCFPIFLNFRGGKGSATGLGAFLAVSPIAVLVCVFLFAAVLAVWHYVSLASMAAASAFPFVLALCGERSLPILIASLVAAGFIIARHRDNIHRLRNGTESSIWGRRNDLTE
ncbi:MAG: glycerol-3-phosphate 1-O-acyltransferase PlsY [Acidobacteria bacterium]|nr:glycerol-3-phosphate 1-O-acyltransferase PlsY [Acidobacteriota bacterium]